MKKVKVFVDGACKGNPGPGGYAAILKCRNYTKEISGYEPNTTNNKMELKAVIMALRELKEPCDVCLYTDSKYVIKGMTEWIHSWIKRGWVTANKKEVLNKELWEELLRLSKKHKIKWIWIKAHNKHPENERCDRLAKSAIQKYIESKNP